MRLSLDVPERYLIDRTPEQLIKHIKLYAALMMFKAGELSAGAACEFAGVDRFAFAAECKEHGIPLVDYSEEELRAELESLRRTRG